MKTKSSPIFAELRQFRPVFVSLGMLSFFGPLLYLAAPLFAHQIMDRVALSRNEGTLWVLFATSLVVLSIYAVLDYLRSRTLQRLGVAVDRRLTETVFDALNRQRTTVNGAASAQPLVDVNTVRDFVSGPMIAAGFDALWTPVFIAAMFWIHLLMGVLALVVITLSVGLTMANQSLVARSARNAAACMVRANDFGNAVFRTTETVVALGMLPRLRQVWYRMHAAALGWQSVANNRTSVIEALLKLLRDALPVIVFTAGGLLYLSNEISLASMTIAMIIMWRALGPIDQVVTGWRGYSNFRLAIERLDDVMEQAGKPARTVHLPRPTGAIEVSHIIGTGPKSDTIVINDVSFTLAPGRVLGVIGPSGAGKSCLARFLVGRWRPRRGQISIGEHDMAHWNEDELGQYLGFMPQDIELLPGTVADNVSRFDPEVAKNSDKLLAATALAGVNDLIKELPNGFNTRIGYGGHVLSGGQRQRLALARAVYGNPHLVVLDEPSAALDAAGEQALGLALERLKQAGSAVVVITHKLSLLSYCDDVMILNAGTVQAFGPRAQIVERLAKVRAAGAPALTVVEGSGPSGDARRSK